MRHFTSIVLPLLLMLMVGVSSFSAGKSKRKKPIAMRSAKLVVSSAIPNQGGLEKSDEGSNNGKVIMMLQTRDHLLTIYSRDQDRLYSVGTKDGIALAEKITSAELKARFPELHEIVTEGVAVDSPMELK
jgi:precorrin-2 methylase